MTRSLALVIHKLQIPTDAFVRSVAQLCADARFEAVLVLVAGAERGRSPRNPLSWGQAAKLLTAAVGSPKLACMPLVDSLYDDGMWVANVRRCVDTLCGMRNLALDDGYAVTLVAADDAKGRAITRLFPDWEHQHTLDKGDTAAALESFLNAGQPAWMSERHWAHIQVQRGLDQVGRKAWLAAEAALGYAIPLQTVDAVVVQSHHVLLTERAPQESGAGLLCLPGTFLQPYGTALDTALDAARVKAGLDMPLGALHGRLRERRVFDHPERDPRGWIRTEAFVFELPPSGRFEKAKQGIWTPLSELHPHRMFADHFDIVQSCTRGVPSPQDALLLNMPPV